jgi:hypothetical protein
MEAGNESGARIWSRWRSSRRRSRVLIATADDEGEIFIASDQPITVAQVQEKLRSGGWLNVQITEQGRYLEIAGSKDGQARKMMVDTLTGRLIADEVED